jgi:hypothetical protein
MWITNATFQKLLTRLQVAEALTAHLRQAAAVQQQNVDWLANHVNRMEIERSTLLQQVLHLSVVAPQIAREDGPPTASLGLGAPLRADDRPIDEEPGMALAALQAGAFEDMGDDAAARFGVHHEPSTGAVQYTR